MTLQEWMDRETLNDGDLAAKLGHKLSRSQINRIRRGECKPTPNNARLLETVTSIPAAAFVMGEAA